jgi:hypothetical protein
MSSGCGYSVECGVRVVVLHETAAGPIEHVVTGALLLCHLPQDALQRPGIGPANAGAGAAWGRVLHHFADGFRQWSVMGHITPRVGPLGVRVQRRREDGVPGVQLDIDARADFF